LSGKLRRERYGALKPIRDFEPKTVKAAPEPFMQDPVKASVRRANGKHPHPAPEASV
jgi:hypothetical protein